MLSARSTDEQVNTITAELFRHFKQPADFAGLEPVQLEPWIQSCGLYKAKAKSIVETSKLLISRHHGEVPDDFEALLELPGVGRKTANVVLAVGFGKPGLGVDTHVQRVSYRLGLSDSEAPDKTEMQLKASIEPKRWGRAHHLLIWHGRETCKSQKPRCAECVLKKHCSWPDQSGDQSFPRS